MKYWFKPDTHWHEITMACCIALRMAGYEEDRLEAQPERPT